jgi:hypothetical protein
LNKKIGHREEKERGKERATWRPGENVVRIEQHARSKGERICERTRGRGKRRERKRKLGKRQRRSREMRVKRGKCL